MRYSYYFLTFLTFLLTGCQSEQICSKVVSSPRIVEQLVPASYKDTLTPYAFEEADRSWIEGNTGLIPDFFESWLREATKLTLFTQVCTVANTSSSVASFSVTFKVQTRSGGAQLRTQSTPSIQIKPNEIHDFKCQIPIRSVNDFIESTVEITPSSILVQETQAGKVIIYRKRCVSCNCNPAKDDASKGMEYLFKREVEIDSLVRVNGGE